MFNEVDEIDDEDLEAAAELYDKLVKGETPIQKLESSDWGAKITRMMVEGE